jgi:hypothetical protein
MIYVVAGTFKEFENFCRNHKISKWDSDVMLLTPSRPNYSRGIRVSRGDKVYLTCGFYNDPDWYWGTFIPCLDDHNIPEFVGCCGRLDFKI